MSEPLLSRADAAKYLAISKSHLAGLAVRGGGPKYAKYSSRLVAYRREDLDEWIESRLRTSTSEK